MAHGVTPDPGESASHPIAARLDALPVTPLHGAIVVLCALGLLFDVIEAALSNALSAVFSAPPYRVQPYQLSLLLASVFVGGVIGAPLLGLMADRYGRRLTLGVALLFLALSSTVAATSPDIDWLTALRVFSGLALGAYPPLMVAYLSDVLPPARRGMLIMTCGAIGFLGAPAVIFLIRWLTPLQPLGFEAWRWALAFGAIGSAIVGALFFCLPESPRWLAATGRHREAEQAWRRFERSAGDRPREAPVADSKEEAQPAAESFWSESARTYRLRAMLLSAMYFLSPWATIGFPLLSGAVLVEKGFRVSDSLLYLGVTMLGPSLGVLAGALVIDRFERRTTLVLCGGLMALIGLAFAASGAPLALMILGTAFNLSAAIYIGALSIYAAELFPTSLRASVSSTAWAVNRIASAVVPIALLPVLKTHGPVAMFAVIAIALIGDMILALVFGPRGLTRKPVE